MRVTYTFSTLEVSPAFYEEVKAKLLRAGYDHAIRQDSGDEELLDMHGIALTRAKLADGVINPFTNDDAAFLHLIWQKSPDTAFKERLEEIIEKVDTQLGVAK